MPYPESTEPPTQVSLKGGKGPDYLKEARSAAESEHAQALRKIEAEQHSLAMAAAILRTTEPFIKEFQDTAFNYRKEGLATRDWMHNIHHGWIAKYPVLRADSDKLRWKLEFNDTRGDIRLKSFIANVRPTGINTAIPDNFVTQSARSLRIRFGYNNAGANFIDTVEYCSPYWYYHQLRYPGDIHDYAFWASMDKAGNNTEGLRNKGDIAIRTERDFRVKEYGQTEIDRAGRPYKVPPIEIGSFRVNFTCLPSGPTHFSKPTLFLDKSNLIPISAVLDTGRCYFLFSNNPEREYQNLGFYVGHVFNPYSNHFIRSSYTLYDYPHIEAKNVFGQIYRDPAVTIRGKQLPGGSLEPIQPDHYTNYLASALGFAFQTS